MTENIKNQIHELYDSLMEKPNKILQIFQDFFGEERVDMQGCYSKEEFCEYLETNSLQIIFPTSNFSISTYLKNIPYISDYWDEWKNKTITSDPLLMEYCIPSLNLLFQHAETKIFSPYIIVHFPNVRITNENDKYIDIRDLWVKKEFKLSGKGKGTFTMNRSHYKVSHISNDYLHSHMCGIPKNDFTHFESPCLGSGPILATISSLSLDYNEPLWQLFCLELDKYVRVESLAGTPYHRLENVIKKDIALCTSNFNNYIYANPKAYLRLIPEEDNIYLFIEHKEDNIYLFIEHIIKSKKLKFNYYNGSYGIGMSFIDIVLTISNEFISWYNDNYVKGIFIKGYNALKSDTLQECIIKNNKIYYLSTRTSEMNSYFNFSGQKVCTFKGRDIVVQIQDDITEEEKNKVVILKLSIIETIINEILKIVNYGYKQ